MDDYTFDELSKALAAGHSRRRAVKTFSAIATGGILGLLRVQGATAAGKPACGKGLTTCGDVHAGLGVCCKPHETCCTNIANQGICCPRNATCCVSDLGSILGCCSAGSTCFGTAAAGYCGCCPAGTTCNSATFLCV